MLEFPIDSSTVACMEDTSGVTIWRYIDLAKFVSMLAGETLYFACPCELDDPYEGYLPKHYFDALSVPIQEIVDEQLQRRAQIAHDRPDVDLASIDAGFAELRSRLQGAVTNVSLRFGVSCWHMNDHESEAMWKVYSAAGHGIAIESTVQGLKASIVNNESVVIDRVRYLDFLKDPIEKGHEHHILAMKRKAFEHERELRAIVPLPEPGKGTLVKCDLDTLIGRIHVSPLAKPYLKPVVEYLCATRPRPLDKPVVQSSLLSRPNYGIEVNLPADLRHP